MYVLTPGTRVRFVSYLNPDCVLGTKDDYARTRSAVLKNLSTNNNSTTIWIIDHGQDGYFKIKWAQERDVYLTMTGARERLWIGPNPTTFPNTDTSGMWRADPVKDGNWFALNTYGGYSVMDVAGSSTVEGTQILSWPWNGGDNQVWRTEVVT